jgi:CheY-like chemotaxis protein
MQGDLATIIQREHRVAGHPATVHPGGVMSKTLLLADDSVTIQKVVGISFASEDVSLLTVDNGDDALLRAREVRPDLVLADVVMPGKNGYEVCAAIKADPDLRHIPVILLTGTFEAFDEERARQVGAAAHVAKPFEAQVLVDQVRRLLAAPPPPPEPRVAPQPAAAPARPLPPKPASPAPQEAGDSFDFFDEDLGDLAARGPGSTAPPNSLDLEGDAGFGFGDEDFSDTDTDEEEASGGFGRLASLRSDPAPDRTVAILPQEDDEELEVEPAELLVTPPMDSGIGDMDLGGFGPAPTLHGRPRPPVEAPPPRRLPAERAPLALDLDDSGADSPLAQQAVVDPNGVSGFDISTSELGDAEEPQAERVAPRVADPRLAETAPRSFDPLPDLRAEPIPDAEALEEPLALAEAVEDEPGGDPLEAIRPQLREQLHDTLEKVAWESFSEVTEKIVRQAVERVEQIAWEVIPHMAETLVREEIRRMKGEK